MSDYTRDDHHKDLKTLSYIYARFYNEVWAPQNPILYMNSANSGRMAETIPETLDTNRPLDLARIIDSAREQVTLRQEVIADLTRSSNDPEVTKQVIEFIERGFRTIDFNPVRLTTTAAQTGGAHAYDSMVQLVQESSFMAAIPQTVKEKFGEERKFISLYDTCDEPVATDMVTSLRRLHFPVTYITYKGIISLHAVGVRRDIQQDTTPYSRDNPIIQYLQSEEFVTLFSRLADNIGRFQRTSNKKEKDTVTLRESFIPGASSGFEEPIKSHTFLGEDYDENTLVRASHLDLSENELFFIKNSMRGRYQAYDVVDDTLVLHSDSYQRGEYGCPAGKKPSRDDLEKMAGYGITYNHDPAILQFAEPSSPTMTAAHKALLEFSESYDTGRWNDLPSNITINSEALETLSGEAARQRKAESQREIDYSRGPECLG